MGSGRLRQIVSYGAKVFHLRQLFQQLRDGRRRARAKTEEVAAAVFFAGLLRVPSFNALEPRLSEKPFLWLVGAIDRVRKLCSADTLGRVMRVMDLPTVRQLSVALLAQAERNKVFREGWHMAMRYVAIDGWEPVQSWSRHCEGCLVRRVKVKDRKGELHEIEQYYHRYVVAMLIGDRYDLMLDVEPVLPYDLRPEGAARDHEDEGELTAAKRLLPRVKETFAWLDVVVADGLYANGPFLTVVKELRMGAVVIARKEGDEPLTEARRIWANKPAEQVIEDGEKAERLELWDCPGLETLTSYQGPIRMVLGRLTSLDRPEAPARDWCVAVTGAATRLSARQVVAVARGRWHIENTGFHQWSKYWSLTHVFTHHPKGILSLYWLFFAAYNLLTLFLYRQLRCYGRDRGRDVTRTIRRLVEEMRDDLARLNRPVWDSS